MSAPTPTPTEQTAAVFLRMPEGLRDRLRAWATEERRSLTGQVLYLLERALEERDARRS